MAARHGGGVAAVAESIAEKLEGHVIGGDDPTLFLFVEPVLMIHALFDPLLEGSSRNMRAIIEGIAHARQLAREGGYRRIGIETEHEPLARALAKLGFQRNGNLLTREV
jgi:hypothetical protein